MARQKQRRWSVALGVLVVVAIGAVVGNIAGGLAHRAPRGSGTRIAVLLPDAAQGPDVALRIAHDAVVRDLQALQDTTVIPPLELASKQKQMVRGRVEDPSPAKAAEVLDADLLVTVTERDVGKALAAARAALKTDEPAGAPITASADAYARFLDGEHKAQVLGDFAGARADYEAATALDPGFAEAWAWLAWSQFSIHDRDAEATQRARDAVVQARAHADRLRPVSRLVVDALHGWFAHDAAAPALRIQLREPAIASCRALTVQFPEERVGFMCLGRAYRELFDAPKEGLRHLESARRLTPDYFPITHQIALGWLHAKDRKHATQALRAFLSAVPGHPEAKRLYDAIKLPEASPMTPEPVVVD